MGELRSFIDQVRGLPDGVFPEESEFARWLDPEAPLHERAYAARQLLRTRKTRLCFVCSYSNGGFAHLHGMGLKDKTALLIPALVSADHPKAQQLEEGVILRWLPRMETAAFIEEADWGKRRARSISALAEDTTAADAIAMDVYFEHFKEKVDRHTLLLREG